MTVYWVMLTLSLTVAFFGNKYFKPRRLDIKSATYHYNVPIMLLSMLPFFCVSAFRYGLATDYWFVYTPMFYRIASGYKGSIVESGYYWLNRAILLFTDDVVWLYIVTSLIFCLFVFSAIFQQSAHLGFSIYLLLSTSFFFFSLNGVRQAIVIAAAFYCIPLIQSKKFLPFFLLMLLFSTIHSTALLYIPFYWLDKLRLTPKKAIAGIALVGIFSEPINRLILLIMGETRYAKYLNTSYLESKFDFSYFIVALFILLFLTYFYPRLHKRFNFRVLYAFQTFALAATLMTFRIAIMVRVAVAFKYAIVLFLPEVTRSIRNPRIRFIVNVAICVTYFLYMYITAVIKGFGEVVPYVSVFD